MNMTFVGAVLSVAFLASVVVLTTPRAPQENPATTIMLAR